MKVLGIGESVVDNAQIINGTIHTKKHVGGPSLIALVVLSRLGIECTLLTTLGRDEESRIIRKTLRHEGVNILAKLQKKTKVNNYLINPQDGSRKKLRGDIIHPDIKHIDRNFIRQFDLIIIDRHEHTAFYEIMQKKKQSAKIIIDPSTEVSSFTLDMIKYADYPIIPIESLTKIGNGRDLSTALQALYKIAKKTVIVTVGELGSIIYDGETIEMLPTIQIQAVDVQGAGDVYRGAFAYGILQGWGIKTSVSFSNKVAAIHCTKLGNAAAIPQKRELQKLLTVGSIKKEINLSTLDKYFFDLRQTI